MTDEEFLDRVAATLIALPTVRAVTLGWLPHPRNSITRGNLGIYYRGPFDFSAACSVGKWPRARTAAGISR
jgi:hypothetical protein